MLLLLCVSFLILVIFSWLSLVISVIMMYGMIVICISWIKVVLMKFKGVVNLFRKIFVRSFVLNLINI